MNKGFENKNVNKIIKIIFLKQNSFHKRALTVQLISHES